MPASKQTLDPEASVIALRKDDLQLDNPSLNNVVSGPPPSSLPRDTPHHRSLPDVIPPGSGFRTNTTRKMNAHVVDPLPLSRGDEHSVSGEGFEFCNSAAPWDPEPQRSLPFPHPLQLPSILSWMGASINTIPSHSICDGSNGFTQPALPIHSRDVGLCPRQLEYLEAPPAQSETTLTLVDPCSSRTRHPPPRSSTRVIVKAAFRTEYGSTKPLRKRWRMLFDGMDWNWKLKDAVENLDHRCPSQRPRAPSPSSSSKRNTIQSRSPSRIRSLTSPRPPKSSDGRRTVNWIEFGHSCRSSRGPNYRARKPIPAPLRGGEHRTGSSEDTAKPNPFHLGSLQLPTASRNDAVDNPDVALFGRNSTRHLFLALFAVSDELLPTTSRKHLCLYHLPPIDAPQHYKLPLPLQLGLSSVNLTIYAAIDGDRRSPYSGFHRLPPVGLERFRWYVVPLYSSSYPRYSALPNLPISNADALI
ncbi:hypothetical protein NMY22_g8503 [Coprinellus aureogranulatus]|nr:hypothetical protein NMY22_g8503 [Coprinellus aureogranulatus]